MSADEWNDYVNKHTFAQMLNKVVKKDRCAATGLYPANDKVIMSATFRALL